MKWTIFTLLVLINQALSAADSLRVEVDGAYLSPTGSISLYSAYHEIIFHFPEYKSSKSAYSFQINELEKKWQNTAYPFARYTNLDGGSYHFQVKYQNTKNQTIILSKAFEIKESFWEKWWFYLFLVMIAAAGISLIIYFWFLYDLRQRMRTHAIRQKIAANLHDEVGANLSSISFLVESLKKSLNGQKEKFELILDRISDNSLESASLINDTIWALNPEYDNFEKLLERLKSFSSTILSAKDIAFSVDNQLDNTNIEMDIEQRRNLFFSLKEAIHNAAKHSRASKVVLKIWNEDREIHLSVADNGKGFDIETLSNGNGLKNFKTREYLDIKIKSERNFGTEVEIILDSKNH